MKKTLLLKLFFLFCSNLLAQEEIDTLEYSPVFFGATFGFGTYGIAPTGSPHGFSSFADNKSFEAGIQICSGGKQHFGIKAGFEYSFYKSPFINDTSVFESFLTLPILIRLANSELNNNPDNRLQFYIGPELMAIGQSGVASREDSKYDISDEYFGGYSKVNIHVEVSLNLYRENRLHVIGIHGNADIVNNASSEITEITPPNYFAIYCFYSILFGGR